MSNGVLVTLNGGIGTLTVPFESDRPVPDIAADEFQEEMVDAVSVVVTSVLSGSSASLAVGSPLDVSGTGGGTPAAPGEFTWELNGARDEATMTFFNESPSGLTLKNGNPYNANLAVSPNAYVETLPAIMLTVSVTGN